MTDRIEVTEKIVAPPERVYSLVSDLTRMGEWSPETTGCTWLGGDTEPRPGARFRGDNRNGARKWSTTCTVLVADPGRELAWEARSLGMPISRWRYQFAPDAGGGTLVTESTEDRRNALIRMLSPMVAGIKDRDARNRETMRITLERLKAAAEQAG
ncbi:MAG: SRPBCC family protein [Acidimicrobiales bacterium]